MPTGWRGIFDPLTTLGYLRICNPNFFSGGLSVSSLTPGSSLGGVTAGKSESEQKLWIYRVQPFATVCVVAPGTFLTLDF